MEKRSYRNRSHRQQHQQHYKSNETRKQHHRRRLVDEEEPQHQREEESSSFCALVGTCQFMCPENERSQRERLRDLAVFERLRGNPAKTSPELAVKKFCRTISSKHVQASDVRPLPVLENTLTHLLNLLDSTDYPFEVVHDFIFDRTRSIRQDLSMQNIENEKSIYLYEKMVRFHVLSHHKLRDCGNDPKISSMHYLNMEQLTKALTSLYNLYALNRQSGSIYENEPEFHSLFVLLHLDSKNQPSGEPLSLWFCHLPRQIIHSKEMHFARNLLRYFRIGNYRRFLATIVSEASYLQYCILEPYIKEVRALLLACINSVGYKLHPYPLSQVSKFLMMKETDAEAFCNSCALEISRDELGNKLLSSKQTTYSYPKSGLQNFDLCGFERIKGE